MVPESWTRNETVTHIGRSLALVWLRLTPTPGCHSDDFNSLQLRLRLRDSLSQLNYDSSNISNDLIKDKEYKWSQFKITISLGTFKLVAKSTLIPQCEGASCWTDFISSAWISWKLPPIWLQTDSGKKRRSFASSQVTCRGWTQINTRQPMSTIAIRRRRQCLGTLCTALITGPVTGGTYPAMRFSGSAAQGSFVVVVVVVLFLLFCSMHIFCHHFLMYWQQW